jgi:hypothetical protein
MIVLLPTTSTQTISIMPRASYFLYQNDVSLNIRKDGDGTTETISSVATALNGNFVDLSFSCSILEEGSTYFLEATSNGNLIYRDKIFSTNQTNYKVKHIISQNLYDPYSPTDDNTYIV